MNERNEPTATAATNIEESTGVFSADTDNTELFYRAWLPQQNQLRRARILIHRGHEHSGRLEEFAKTLAGPDTGVFSFDMRGHGHSPGRRGDARDFHQWVEDLDAFVRFVTSQHQLREQDLGIIASSVGAVVATTWVHDYGAKISGMVLAAPAFSINLYVPLALPALRGAHKLGARPFLKSYVRPAMLTSDAAQATAYAEDPLITKDIGSHLLTTLDNAAKRIIADAAAIRVPTMVLSAGRDAVVRSGPQRQFFDNLGSEHKQWIDLPDAKHAVFHETDRLAIYDQCQAFLETCETRPTRATPEPSPHTVAEFERLKQRPGHPLKAIGFAIQRLSMKTLGRLSDGISLGWKAGFDSGETLDYVYRNQAQGKTILGRWIDRAYLDSVGWQGIRDRGDLVRNALRDEIAKRPGQKLRIVDLATGGGRYVLEALDAPHASNHEVLLRDWSEGSLTQARSLANQLGLEDITFEKADALDADSVAGVGQADILLVSGLYELFPDNAPIEESLRGIAQALKPGGTLIYTCQPWHPQVEMIARVLSNRNGEPWIMRRRTQPEMDDLVEHAGLTKQRTQTEPYGIFTVSTAIKTKEARA